MDKNYELDNRIRLIGSKFSVETAEERIGKLFSDIAKDTEPVARLKLQSILESKPTIEHISILINGNSIWDSKKILKAINKVKKEGMDKMTDYLYAFLNLSCGSIAHYNKAGWIDTYPTIGDLRSFFRSNEFGERVLKHVPAWQTDVIEIVKKIEKALHI